MKMIHMKKWSIFRRFHRLHHRHGDGGQSLGLTLKMNFGPILLGEKAFALSVVGEILVGLMSVAIK